MGRQTRINASASVNAAFMRSVRALVHCSGLEVHQALNVVRWRIRNAGKSIARKPRDMALCDNAPSRVLARKVADGTIPEDGYYDTHDGIGENVSHNGTLYTLDEYSNHVVNVVIPDAPWSE